MKHFNYYASPASINSAMEIRIASWNWKRPIQDYQKEANGFLKEHGIIYDNPDKFLLNPMVSKTDKLSAAFYCVCKGNADCIEFLVKEMLCNKHKKLRRLAGELLAKLAWADYPMSRTDNNYFPPSLYMLLGDFHLGIFGDTDYRMVSMAADMYAYVADNYGGDIADIAAAKLRCVNFLQRSAYDPPKKKDLLNLRKDAERYVISAMVYILYNLTSKKKSKKAKQKGRAEAAMLINRLATSNYFRATEMLSFIAQEKILGKPDDRLTGLFILSTAQNRFSDYDWYRNMTIK